jgi:hypothetical protein
MKTLLIIIAIVVTLGATIILVPDKKAATLTTPKTEDREEALSYFITSLTERAKGSVKDYHNKGLAGGVDGFTLLKIYPGLAPADFAGISTGQGDYSVTNRGLTFTGNAASNSAVINRDGMRKLLSNCSKRLGMPKDRKTDIDQLLLQLKK